MRRKLCNFKYYMYNIKIFISSNQTKYDDNDNYLRKCCLNSPEPAGSYGPEHHLVSLCKNRISRWGYSFENRNFFFLTEGIP